MAKVFLHDQTRESAVENGYGARLTVACPSGSVVNVACGQTEYTVTSDSSNKAVFEGLHHGTWEITLTGSGQNVRKTVEIITDYEIVIDLFTGTIVVEYPEDSVCTCTNGIVTYTAPDTSGIWYCTVSDTGTWTVSCTDGSHTKTKDVELSYTDNYADILLSYFTVVINVTYPNGAICSCSNGDILYSASSTTGNWSFTVYKAGVWTVSATDGIQTVNSTVNVSYDGQVENVTIKFFAATISVTYPEGATCTCTDGITSFTAPDTSGRWNVTVPRTGTWSIRAYQGKGDVTQTVNITRDGQSASVLCEFFIAYINVSYPKNTFKVTLWYINEYGVKEDVAVDNSGSGTHRFTVEQTGSYEIGVYRVSPYVGIESEAKDYTSGTVSITEDKQTIDISLAYVTLPEFTYSGTYKLLDDDENELTTTDGDWNIVFLTSGVARFTKLNGAANGIDVFVLGGGGNGGELYLTTAGGKPYYSGGGGGGGGYRTNTFDVEIVANTPYEIVVGGGGGGNSSAFSVSANGGGNGGSSKSGGEGGDGGSRGGKGGEVSDNAQNGEDGMCAFLKDTGYRYGGGGGGGAGFDGAAYVRGEDGEGGKDGGAEGGESAEANTGGGGGGCDVYDDGLDSTGTGGSGIVIIRNKR